MIGLSAIEEKLITIREKQILLVRDVAFLMGLQLSESMKLSKITSINFRMGMFLF
jgi:hypothetical protein